MIWEMEKEAVTLNIEQKGKEIFILMKDKEDKNKKL